jgi:4-amino-4-deoxy-L-arabinose transferase-like glycosyltransferase
VVWIKKHFWEILLILLLFVIGIYFRLKGISTNQSFWSDEAFPSSIARDILLGKISFTDGINVLGYQRLQVVTNLITFKIFGLSEWSARIPSVLWGSLGIIFAYLLAKKHSNKSGGFLAAFFFTFLQLNLDHSTQAKPYAAIETLLIAVIY